MLWVSLFLLVLLLVLVVELRVVHGGLVRLLVRAPHQPLDHVVGDDAGERANHRTLRNHTRLNDVHGGLERGALAVVVLGREAHNAQQSCNTFCLHFDGIAVKAERICK
jgi:hypothetical protein